jgi:succinoglycan biosynthesis protein ExoV
MIIEYCRSKTLNFGDDLNPWLWPQLMGEDIFKNEDGVYFVGIGTVLTKKRLDIQLADAKEIVIFSSGAWGENTPILSDKCKVYGVRGPRTAKKLGLSENLAIGDGAYLLRNIPLAPVEKQFDIGFIPHHGSEQYIDWQVVCDQLGIKFISAKQPVEAFLLQLRSCRKIVTEAMHGAITADAMRIPWIPVKFSPLFSEEKWYDFAECMEIELKFQVLTFISQNKMKLPKLIEIGAKKLLSKLLGIKPKWSELIFTPFPADSERSAKLVDELKAIIATPEAYLSTDKKVDEITNRQNDILMKIVEDYKS